MQRREKKKQTHRHTQQSKSLTCDLVVLGGHRWHDDIESCGHGKGVWRTGCLLIWHKQATLSRLGQAYLSRKFGQMSGHFGHPLASDWPVLERDTRVTFQDQPSSQSA